MMMMKKYDSSESGSAAASPKRVPPPLQPYYVQSPSSRHDSAQVTPACPSPLQSPSYSSSYVDSSAASTRASGNWRRRSGKWWRECKVIEEEVDEGKEERGCCWKALFGAAVLGLVFALFCLLIWGASQPYKPSIMVKGLRVHNLYKGEGSDHTGVPTRLLTINCSVSLVTYNPSPFFGIHLTSTPIHLIYSKIIVAAAEMKEYYQASKSYRELSLMLEGENVPLYGTGESLVGLDDNNNGGIPLELDFVLRSKGYLVGKLVKTKQQCHVSCSLKIKSSKYVNLNSSCAYL